MQCVFRIVTNGPMYWLRATDDAIYLFEISILTSLFIYLFDNKLLSMKHLLQVYFWHSCKSMMKAMETMLKKRLTNNTCHLTKFSLKKHDC